MGALENWLNSFTILPPLFQQHISVLSSQCEPDNCVSTDHTCIRVIIINFLKVIWTLNMEYIDCLKQQQPFLPNRERAFVNHPLMDDM